MWMARKTSIELAIRDFSRKGFRLPIKATGKISKGACGLLCILLGKFSEKIASQRFSNWISRLGSIPNYTFPEVNSYVFRWLGKGWFLAAVLLTIPITIHWNITLITNVNMPAILVKCHVRKSSHQTVGEPRKWRLEIFPESKVR